MANNDDRIDDPRILAQKRNLLIISAVLSMYILSGVDYKEASILGNKFEMRNPENLRVILWVLWMYMLAGFFHLTKAVQKRTRDIFIGLFYGNMINYMLNERTQPRSSHVDSLKGINGPFIIFDSWMGIYLDWNGSTVKDFKETKERVPRRVVIVKFTKSIFSHIINSIHFYDYTLPLLFALSPVISWIFNWFFPVSI